MTPAEVLEEEVRVRKPIVLAKELKLHVDVVTQTIAILAIKRSGKSFAARRLFEQLFKAGQQVVTIDPKGDWWGERYGADGKSPGIEVIILGGEHGDLPLDPSSGEIVAQFIVDTGASVILDLSLMRKHERVTFLIAFAEALYRLKAQEKYRTPMMLFIDEADQAVPQKPTEKGPENRMLGAMQDVVQRGGQRGIGCTMITQRSAVINKNVLTQCQILVALRTISPQDRKALDAWIEVHGTLEQRATLMESIASLPRGDAWVWSPGWPDDEGIFKRVRVERIETFDSGATPKPGEKRIVPKKRAEIDLDALGRHLTAAVEQKKATDPKELQREIARLKAELAKKPAAAPAPAKVETKVVERSVLKRQDLQSLNVWSQRAETAAAHIADAVAKLGEKLARAQVQGAPPPAAPRPAPPPPAARRPIAPAPGPRGSHPPPDGEEPGLRSGERRLLQVAAGAVKRTRAQLGTLAGFTPSGGTFSTYFGRLKRFGFIVEDSAGNVTATDVGLAELGLSTPPAPQSRDEVLRMWRESLRAGEWRMLEVLLVHPEGLSREDLGRESGFAASGGTFSTYLGVLKRNGLAEESGGLVFASELVR